MKILLTNDDGFDAEGLQALAQVLAKSHECYVVAPDRGRSCCGHSVTTGESLEIVQRNLSGWSVSGTPADCVRVGLLWLKLKPDWVISGVNHGGNLGVDILYSGTIAGAREACHLGVSSVAISQYMRRDVERDWSVTAIRAQHVISSLFQANRPNKGFWSVNLPAIPAWDSRLDFPITHCEPESQPLDFSFEHSSAESAMVESNPDPWHCVLYKSNYQLRPRNPGSDVDLCFQGHATITWLGAGHYLQ